MARKTAVKDVQGFVVSHLEDARKTLQGLEKKLVKRGRAQQKELEALLKSIRTGKPFKAIEKQATSELKKRFDALQSQVFARLGVASQSEISQIYRELTKLSKKLDGLVTKKTPLSLTA